MLISPLARLSPLGGSSSPYWTPPKIALTFLFDAFTKDIAGGRLYNTVAGRTSEYLTVTGSAGSYHYTCPDTADYIAADTDLAWFKTGHTIGDTTTVSDMTDSRLNSYDLQRTPVQFDDANPNTNRRISILLSTVTLSATDLNHLFQTWQLPIEWHNDTNGYGHIKSNRTGQNLWTPDTITIPTVSTATIENGAKANVVITFNHTLNTSYVPATSAFTLAGKTINNVAIAGAVVTLTVSVAYAYGDTPTVSYTKPASNWLRDNTTGGSVATFSGQSVTNHIAASYPATLIDTSKTVGWYEAQDLANITKDAGTGEVSLWKDKNNTGHDLAQATATYLPIWSVDGVLYDGSNDLMVTAPFTFNQPETVYMVVKQVTRKTAGAFFDGNAAGSGCVWTPGTSPNTSLYAGAQANDNINLVAGQWSIIRACINYENSTLQIDNTSPSTGDPGDYSMGGITVGALHTGGGQYSNNQYKELIFRNVADDAATSKDIYNYLAAKYGLPTI
jgi:Putative flagellar system-associated repeat